MRVLVVEDTTAVREEIVLLLTLEGFTVEEAPNGLVGLEAVRQGTFDLVICDVMMPKLDGFAMVRLLRTDPAYATLPVLFLTARADHDSMREGMTLGADDYLTKPFSADELLHAVRVQFERGRLRHAQSEQKVRDLRGELAASLPHELRTPLQVIAGYAEMLLDAPGDTPPSEWRQWARNIGDAVRRLDRLTENFLLSAQIDLLERTPASPRSGTHRTAIADAISEVGAAIAAAAKRSDDLQCHLAPCTADLPPGHLQKILFEVIDNAFKFSPPGSPVSIETRVTADAVEIRVNDRGPGIPARAVKSIGAFQQFDRHQREQQGLGLGLSIAARLAALCGGALTVESCDGPGTTIVLQVPRVLDGPRTAQAAGAAVAS